jgi:hypothetical protein
MIELDSRPSDAIALALRSGSQILVAPEVLDRVERIEEGEGGDGDWRSRLEKSLDGDGGPTERPARSRAKKATANARCAKGPKPEASAPADDGQVDPAEVYRALLESLSDEDFGKWKM